MSPFVFPTRVLYFPITDLAMDHGNASASQGSTPIQTGRPGFPPSNTIQTVSPTAGRVGIPQGVGEALSAAHKAIPAAKEGSLTWTRDLRSGSCVLRQIPA